MKTLRWAWGTLDWQGSLTLLPRIRTSSPSARLQQSECMVQSPVQIRRWDFQDDRQELLPGILYEIRRSPPPPTTTTTHTLAVSISRSDFFEDYLLSFKLHAIVHAKVISARSLHFLEDFSDVTLVCSDGKQFEAHKVIFAI